LNPVHKVSAQFILSATSHSISDTPKYQRIPQGISARDPVNYRGKDLQIKNIVYKVLLKKFAEGVLMF